MFFKAFFITSQFLVITYLPHLSRGSDVSEDVYDFIIVGGGTAGCAVARRLSESGKHSVLVLEYGDYPNPGFDIPALQANFLNNENRKVYRSVQQIGGDFSSNRTFGYTIARILGGGSSINGMGFNRGSPHSYNEWARITEDSSWNYSNLMKYFRKIEDYHGDFPSDTEHGIGGPITISVPKYAPGLEQWFEAGRYLGYPIADPNGPQRVCFAPLECSKRFGRRVSSYSGYLKPLLQSRQIDKLKVIVKAEVKRIIFLGDRAIGIIYEERNNPGQDIYIAATKEVIISAGVINSALILMKSGIGPREDLEAAKISVLKSLPVGKNLHDHLLLKLNMILGNRSAAMIPERDLTPENLQFFNETGEGPYTSFLGISGQAFLASSKATRNDLSDIEIVLGGNPASGSVQTGGTQEFQVALWEVPVIITLLSNVPRSRGYLTLNATHPDKSDPVINFRYLSHPDDIKILVEGIKMALQIFEDTPVYQRMGARYPSEPISACSHLTFRSDPYWECVIRQNVISGSHGAGTCRMGKGKGDPDSVVDSQLKVIGFENVRVVDASVMPMVTNANIMAAVYVIAEKASEMILNDWE